MKRRPARFVPLARALVCCCAIALFAVRPARAAGADATTFRSEHFDLVAPAKERGLGEHILEIGETARQAVLDQMPLPFDDRVVLQWCATQREFGGHLGGRAEHILAFAVPATRRIYLNGEQLQRLDRARLHQTFVHEFTHIYIGHVSRKPIPLWLNEGLAMHAAREWSTTDAAALAAASWFGGLAPPDRLARRFPGEPAARRRAYRQGYSMTAYLLHMRYDQSGVGGLVEDLADRDGRSVIHALLANPKWIEQFDRSWRKQWLRKGRVVLILTSSGTFWLLVTFLFLAAYARKRRTKKQREATWAFEEEFGYHNDGFDD